MAVDSSPFLPWHVAGSYFESCNCEAICPCRRVGSVLGGRSTYGICFGTLSWLVESGRAGETDLAGLGAALVYRYDDDEPGSPWRCVLYVDERGDERQREALEQILLGRLGGARVVVLPWVRKPVDLVGVQPARIEIEHDRQGHRVRVGDSVSVSASRPVETDNRVSCIVPSHEIAGTELYADELRAAADSFDWELAGTCAFVAPFEYDSNGA